MRRWSSQSGDLLLSLSQAARVLARCPTESLRGRLLQAVLEEGSREKYAKVCATYQGTGAWGLDRWCRRLLVAGVWGLVLVGGGCAEPPEPEGQIWSFPEYELALRLPESWEVSDAYALYARQSRLPEPEVRKLTLPEVVRKVRFLLVARPSPGENHTRACSLSIQVEDLSSYPNITDVEAYAALAERAAKRHLREYERLGPDTPVSLGHTSMIRREVRAVQALQGSPVGIRSLTLFWKHGNMGIAIGAYELDGDFEQRRPQFESILESVQVGPAEPQSWWSRWLGRGRGSDPESGR